MSQNDQLQMLKIDLGITTTAYDARLAQLLIVAASEIVKEGASTLDASSSVSDANLVVMYAAWLWRRRDTMDGMPKMLRWQLNNRVLGEKANV